MIEKRKRGIYNEKGYFYNTFHRGSYKGIEQQKERAVCNSWIFLNTENNNRCHHLQKDKNAGLNHKTNNTLLTLFPFNGNYKAKKTYYDETGKEISEDEATAIIKPKKPSDKPLIFMTVNAENVISVT